MLVDAKGDITVKSDTVRQALDYYKQLMAFLPADAPAWDDASNNKWLVVGQGRADHEPAERLGGRQARRAEGRRAAAGRTASPAGPKGRFAPFVPFFWGIWNFSKNQSAAKSLLIASVAAGRGREDGDGQRRLRPAVVREPHHLQDLGRGGAAQGHALSLPQPVQPPDPVDRRRARAAQDRRADLRPGHPDPDGRSATSRARPWRRRSTGRPRSSKASCATRRTTTTSADAIARWRPPKHRQEDWNRREFVMADIAARGPVTAAAAAAAACTS